MQGGVCDAGWSLPVLKCLPPCPTCHLLSASTKVAGEIWTLKLLDAHGGFQQVTSVP